MPISDAANINSTGVLISSTNLNTLKLSEDGETMSIGPGPRWGDVFNYLEFTNKTVVGGRLAPVGVPGLLLGGGISWYSVKHGLASSGGKIKAYEVRPSNQYDIARLTHSRLSLQMVLSPPSPQTAATRTSTGPSAAAATPSP